MMIWRTGPGRKSGAGPIPHSLVNKRWHRDIGEVEVADVLGAAQADFRQSERHGCVGADDGAGDLTGRHVETRWGVEGHNRRRDVRHRVDQGGRSTSRCAAQAVTDQRVDGDVSARWAIDDGQPHALHNVELVAGNATWCLGQGDCYAHAGVRKMSRCDQPAPAVAARAAQYGRGSGVVEIENEAGQVASRVFHHLDQLDADVLDHDAVDLAHLVCADPRDLVSEQPGSL